VGRRIVLALAFGTVALVLLVVLDRAGWFAVLAAGCILAVLLGQAAVVSRRSGRAWLTVPGAVALFVVTGSTFVTMQYAFVPYSVRGVRCGDAMTVQADLGDRRVKSSAERTCLGRAKMRLAAAAVGAGALTLSVLPYVLATRSEEP
jgi:hypothetical protein